jgi:hypothetical protein
MSLLKAVELNINANGLIMSFTFHVAPTLSAGQSIIIGLDFLTKFECVINLASRTVTFCNELTAIPLQNKQLGANMCATVADDFRLKPTSETIMLLNVPGCFNGSTVQVETIRTLTERSIANARSVSKPTAGKVNCRLLNPTSRPITLKRNAIIATLQSVSDDCVSPFIDYLTDHVDVETNNHDDLTNEVDVDAVIAELGIDLAPSVLSTERKRQLAQLIASFSDIFAKDISQLGDTTAFSFKVETGDQPSIRKRMYRYSPEQMAEIDRQITEMLKSDVIFPLNSMWQSPMVLVHRKNADSNLPPPPPPRFAIDFRGLKAVTKSLAQASVRFDDVIDAVAGVKADTYTVLDFRSGFYQIPLADEESMDRCSFVCHSGVYSYKVLPFGVRNGSVAFQTMMTSLLRHMLFVT